MGDGVAKFRVEHCKLELWEDYWGESEWIEINFREKTNNYWESTLAIIIIDIIFDFIGDQLN